MIQVPRWTARGGSRTSSKGDARVNNRALKFDHAHIIAANETNSQKDDFLLLQTDFVVKFMSDQVFLA